SLLHVSTLRLAPTAFSLHRLAARIQRRALRLASPGSLSLDLVLTIPVRACRTIQGAYRSLLPYRSVGVLGSAARDDCHAPPFQIHRVLSERYLWHGAPPLCESHSHPFLLPPRSAQRFFAPLRSRPAPAWREPRKTPRRRQSRQSIQSIQIIKLNPIR